MGERGEPPLGRQPFDSLADFHGGGIEQSRGPRRDEFGQRLGCRHLGHLAEVRPPTSLRQVIVDRIGECADELERRGCSLDGDAKAGQFQREVPLAGGEGDLGQE